jgi:predicted AAA+ superfamily ATPase
MKPHIQRLLADRIRGLAVHFPVVLITGARQTGKTTLLRDLFPEAPFHTLDLPSVAHEAEHNSTAFLDSLSAHPTVILDEVQYAPALFRILKAAVDADRHRMGRFLMTGSQKFALMQSVSESLAGRCAILELDTLAPVELIDTNPVNYPTAEEMMWRGGYPELWRVPDMPARDFYSSYFATYLERDVRQLVNVTNLRDFERFVRMCATLSGNLVNFQTLASTVGISGSTAKQWLTVLEASNIIHILPPYFRNHGKRLIKTPKLFFRDTGLLCFLLGLSTPQQMVESTFIGAIWETYVLGQVLRAREAQASPAEIYFWRDAQGVEVDFAVWLNGRLQFIEAKWNETGGDSKALKPMHQVRSVLGDAAADRHLLACRTPAAHWHPNDPSVRVINAHTFRDWFDVPTPEAMSVAEAAISYTVKPRKKRPATRKRVHKKAAG